MHTSRLALHLFAQKEHSIDVKTCRGKKGGDSETHRKKPLRLERLMVGNWYRTYAPGIFPSLPCIAMISLPKNMLPEKWYNLNANTQNSISAKVIFGMNIWHPLHLIKSLTILISRFFVSLSRSWPCQSESMF